ncbi:MAG: potassium channel family protein [Phycisphaerae bacterium]
MSRLNKKNQHKSSHAKRLVDRSRIAEERQIVEQRKRFISAILILAAVIVVGTVGFTYIQPEWGPWEALYFTMITITTVGYGDYGLNAAGQQFTSVLLIFGIVAASYAFGQFVQTMMVYQMNGRRAMQRQIDAIQGHFILCGLGRIGRAVAENLSESCFPFVILDPDKDRCEWAEQHGYVVINGSAADDEMLYRAGIERAHGVICAAAADTDNIVITLTARDLNPDITIVSRADNEDSIHKLTRAGANHVVAPALRSGNEMAAMLTRPHLASFLSTSRTEGLDHAITEISIRDGSKLVGETIRGYGQKEASLVFVAIKHGGDQMQLRPGPEETFSADDVVIVIGESNAISRMATLAMDSNQGHLLLESLS